MPGVMLNNGSNTATSLQLSLNAQPPSTMHGYTNGSAQQITDPVGSISPPSYLSISCAVSGYSSINRYDSSARDVFRSRDCSPAPPRLSFTRSRDSSPHRTRLTSPDGTKCTPAQTAVRISELKAQLARCAQVLVSSKESQQNGGGLGEHRSRQNSVRRRDNKPPSGRSISVDRGYLTKASLLNCSNNNGTTAPPYDHSNTNSQHYHSSNTSGHNMTSHQVLARPVKLIDTNNQSRDVSFNGHIGTASSNNLTNYHHVNTDNIVADTRSFIQERIERLYGPGALAAGFIRRSSDNMGNTVKRTPARGTPGRVIPIQLEGDASPRSSKAYDAPDSSTRDELEQRTQQGMPSVFRHLRPEFRHQLPVKSPVTSPLNGEKIIPINLPDINGVTLAPVADTNGVKKGVPDSNGVAPNMTTSTTIDSPSSRVAASIVPCPGDSRINVPVSDSTTQPVKLNGSVDKVWDSVPEVSATVTPTVAAQSAPVTEEAATTTADDAVKDGHYYLKVVKVEVASLEVAVAEIEAGMERPSAAAMTEELNGKVFSTIGKTKLLISQKIKQFTGLCHKNIAGQSGSDEFPTTCGDLAGFWDMVSLQVTEVRGQLVHLAKCRDNDWQEVAAVVDKVSRDTTDSVRPTRKLKAAAAPATAASKAKDAARKQAAMERRTAMKEAMKAKRAAAKQDDGDVITIFLPEK